MTAHEDAVKAAAEALDTYAAGYLIQRGHIDLDDIRIAVAAAAPILLADAKLIFETLTVTSKAREEQVERLIAEVARARVEGCSQHFDEWQKAVAALAAERAEVERLNRVIAAYEEDADVALVEMAEAVEAESQAADSVIARKDAEIERLQAALALQAESVEAASTREDHIKAAERARIAAAIRAAGHPDGYHRVDTTREWAGIYCADCAVTERSARIAETAPEGDPPCPTCGHPMTVHDVNEGWICKRHPRIAETAPEEGP